MITSAQNQKIKNIRALLTDRVTRQKEGLYVVEGVRSIEEAAASGLPLDLVLYSNQLSERGKALVEQLGNRGVPIEEVQAQILENLSETETSQGILAVLPMPMAVFPIVWDLILVLDRLRDPGNLGTILRSSAASGVQAVVLTPATTDPFAPKVVRSAMGAQFTLPILTMTWPEIIEACKNRNPSPAAILVADSAGGMPCWQTDLKQATALVIGSEADGPQPEAYQAAAALLHIPMPGRAESLNAAVAASILLYEIVRQRSS